MVLSTSSSIPRPVAAPLVLQEQLSTALCMGFVADHRIPHKPASSHLIALPLKCPQSLTCVRKDKWQARCPGDSRCRKDTGEHMCHGRCRKWPAAVDNQRTKYPRSWESSTTFVLNVELKCGDGLRKQGARVEGYQ